VPYDITFYQRRSDQRAPKELRNIHPLGKSPVITDGEITLAESGAIIRVYLDFVPLLVVLTDHWLSAEEYIINKYGNGRVAPPPEGELADIFCNSSANLRLNALTDNLASYSLLGRHFDASPR
jgi:glutathione S-transferase